MHRIKDRTSPTELNVFTELVLPLLELLSPATTVHLEPSDLAHALSALQMAYDLSGGITAEAWLNNKHSAAQWNNVTLLKRSQGADWPQDQSEVEKIYSAEQIETTRTDPASKLDG